MQPTQDPAALVARVDDVLDAALTEQRIVGAVFLVAREGSLVCERAVGRAQRETQQPMRTDTLFRLSSITKPYVSAAALSLVAHGRLSLEDRIEKWLPEFRPRLADGATAPITVQQLLTHTAGLGYGFQEPADGPYHRANVSDGLDQPGLSLVENLRRLASVPLLRKPGTAWQYSVAIDVLGAVMERAAGSALPAIVAELVTGPLSMRDTAFRVVDRARLATPYVDGSPPARMTDPQIVPYGTGAGISYSPSRALDERSFASGGTGMVGSAPDTLRFIECMRKGGAPILPAALARAAMSNRLGALAGPMPGFGFGYGGAVLLDPQAAQTPQGRGTWLWGGVYGHSWFVDPHAQMSCVLLTNTALEGMMGRLTVDLRNALYDTGNNLPTSSV
jgi:CubicO group peptidase (beta-lactamase class C family)